MSTLDDPIEDVILEFVNHMRADMDAQVRLRTGFLDRKLRQQAYCYSNAYLTVEKFILKEMKLREELKDLPKSE